MSVRIVKSLAVALCALPLAVHGKNGSDSLEYQANRQAAPRPLPQKGPMTVEEMEAFVDGFMASQMKSGPVAGATVVVVKDGFIAGIAVLLIITTLVSTIRQRRVDSALGGPLRWARPTLALSGVFLLLFLVTIALTLAGGFVNLIYKIPTSLYVALTFPLLAIPFALLATWLAVSVWRARVWTFGARLHYSLAAVAVLAFLIVLNYWNLLGYRFG